MLLACACTGWSIFSAPIRIRIYYIGPGSAAHATLCYGRGQLPTRAANKSGRPLALPPHTARAAAAGRAYGDGLRVCEYARAPPYTARTVRLKIIGHEILKSVGKYQPCMVSKSPIIFKPTRQTKGTESAIAYGSTACLHTVHGAYVTHSTLSSRTDYTVQSVYLFQTELSVL